MNAMALVQGIVRLTRADTVASYAASIQARVATLAANPRHAGRASLVGHAAGGACRL